MKNKFKILEHPSIRGTATFVSNATNIAGTGTMLYYYTGTDLVSGDFVYLYGALGNRSFQTPILAEVMSVENGEIIINLEIQTNPATAGFDNLILTKEFTSELLSTFQDDYIKFNYNELSQLAVVDSAGLLFNDSEREPLYTPNPYLSGGIYYDIIITRTDNIKEKYRTRLTADTTAEYYNFYDIVVDLTLAIYTGASVSGYLTDTRINIEICENDNFIAQLYYKPDGDHNITMNTKSILKGLFDKKLFAQNYDIKDITTSWDDYTELLIKNVSFEISSNSKNNRTLREVPVILDVYATPFTSHTGRASLEEYLPIEYTQVRRYLTPFNKIKYKTGDVMGYIGVFSRGDRESEIIASIPDVVSKITPFYINLSVFKAKAIDVSNSVDIGLRYNGIWQQLGVQLIELDKTNNNINLIWFGEDGIGQYFFNCEYSERITREDNIKISNKYYTTNYNNKKRVLSCEVFQVSNREMKAIATILNASQIFIYSFSQDKLFNIELNTNSLSIRETDEVRYNIKIDFEVESYVEL